MAESEEELKSLLMKMKEESENFGLKLNIQKTKVMATCSVTSWQTDGEKMETVTEFILGGSKTTADGDCSYEIKRLLLQRHYFVNKGQSSQGHGFSSGHVGCESWTVKKAECRRLMLLNCGVGEDS